MAWCPTFRRNLTEEEENQLLALLNLLKEIFIPDHGEDGQVWAASKNGSLSISSFDLTGFGDPATVPSNTFGDSKFFQGWLFLDGWCFVVESSL